MQEANCFEVCIHKFCLVAIWQKCNNLSLANSNARDLRCTFSLSVANKLFFAQVRFGAWLFVCRLMKPCEQQNAD